MAYKKDLRIVGDRFFLENEDKIWDKVFMMKETLLVRDVSSPTVSLFFFLFLFLLSLLDHKKEYDCIRSACCGYRN